MSAKDGGPAFPGWHESEREWEDGMSLRDYFAAKAMQAIINSMAVMNDSQRTLSANHVGQTAYWYADQMLAERERDGDG